MQEGNPHDEEEYLDRSGQIHNLKFFFTNFPIKKSKSWKSSKITQPQKNGRSERFEKGGRTVRAGEIEKRESRKEPYPQNV